MGEGGPAAPRIASMAIVSIACLLLQPLCDEVNVPAQPLLLALQPLGRALLQEEGRAHVLIVPSHPSEQDEEDQVEDQELHQVDLPVCVFRGGVLLSCATGSAVDVGAGEHLRWGHPVPSRLPCGRAQVDRDGRGVDGPLLSRPTHMLVFAEPSDSTKPARRAVATCTSRRKAYGGSRV